VFVAVSRDTIPILVTGSAGFIGSNFVRKWLRDVGTPVISLDLLTYAGNLDSLFEARSDPRHKFIRGDIGDHAGLSQILQKHRPRAIVNFVAESHVDRSILGPEPFVTTNVVGTFRLLEAAREYWNGLAEPARSAFRFLHVSTDEVFGSLDRRDPPFCETTAYDPSSPYSATKAAADHLVRAWNRTYGLPVLVTHCSNNYGPAQFPEKLIPLMILNALEGKSLPVYGDGLNVRDWIYVEDHCAAIMRILDAGAAGETYCVGAGSERTNIEVVRALCEVLNRARPRGDGRPHEERITFVTDRPGHDRRYAIDSGKMARELGWQPSVTFEEGLERTVGWYLANEDWVRRVRSGEYLHWVQKNYAHRGG
jgi:dTDP-glucose 4,6-dehydratase